MLITALLILAIGGILVAPTSPTVTVPKQTPRRAISFLRSPAGQPWSKDFCLADADTGIVFTLIKGCAHIRDYAWSPSGRKVAIEDGDVRAHTSRILILDLDDGSVSEITAGLRRASDATWSPDGSRVAFSSDDPGNWDIFTANIAEGTHTKLTDNPAPELNPAWRPDGRRLLFVRSIDGRYKAETGALITLSSAIVTIGADGTDEVICNEQRALRQDPAWSPDGDRIAYVSNWTGSEEVWSMDADGGTQRRLTTNTAHEVNPIWSPDGSRLTYGSFNLPGVFTVSASGGDEKKMTEHGDRHSLSPEGTPEVFVSNSNGGSAIFVMDVASGKAQRLMQLTPGDRLLRWVPTR
jgi:TolB protein